MAPLLGGKRALAPDLPFFQSFPVISIMSAGQMPLPLGCKITVFQLSGAPPVILAQTLFPQRAAPAVLLSVTGKGIPLQLCVGTVMGGLGPDKERDSLLLQHPVSQRRNTFRTVGFRRRSRLIVL